jgi:hypothetical protein
MAKQKAKSAGKAEVIETASELSVGLVKISPAAEAHQKIMAKLAELKVIEETPYKTSGVIRLGPIEHNLKSITNIGTLIELTGTILAHVNIHKLGVDFLELDGHPKHLISGYDPELLLHDIALRYKVVSINDERKKIKVALKTLSGHFSAKDKLAQDMAQIQEDLGIDLSGL